MKEYKTSNKTAIILGNNIKYFRQQKGLSQAKLAELIGGDKHYLSEVEHAKAAATTEYIDRVCDALDVNRIELFKDREFNFKPRVDSRK